MFRNDFSQYFGRFQQMFFAYLFCFKSLLVSHRRRLYNIAFVQPFLRFTTHHLTIDSIFTALVTRFFIDQRFLIANVLGFSFLNCKTYRQREYSLYFKDITLKSITERNKTIGVLCTSFTSTQSSRTRWSQQMCKCDTL